LVKAVEEEDSAAKAHSVSGFSAVLIYSGQSPALIKRTVSDIKQGAQERPDNAPSESLPGRRNGGNTLEAANRVMARALNEQDGKSTLADLEKKKKLKKTRTEFTLSPETLRDTAEGESPGSTVRRGEVRVPPKAEPFFNARKRYQSV